MIKHFLASAAAGLLAASAQAGTVVTIDPDGAGPASSIGVASLGYNNGNAIAIPDGGTIVPTPSGFLQTYGHGALANFNNALGNSIGGTGLNSSYEWTYVFGFRELATPIGVQNANFDVAAGGNNFFRVYYDASQNASNLQGMGFNDGTLVLSGSIVSGTGTFRGGGCNPLLGTCPALDQFVSNNYPGIVSDVGTGTSQFNATVSLGFINSSFFPGLTSGLSINVNTFENQPYQQTDPSSCFYNGTGTTPNVGGAGPGNFGGACANTIGSANGFTGPNVMFETRATNDFNTLAVPEPGALALAALALLSLGLVRRRKS